MRSRTASPRHCSTEPHWRPAHVGGRVPDRAGHGLGQSTAQRGAGRGATARWCRRQPASGHPVGDSARATRHRRAAAAGPEACRAGARRHGGRNARGAGRRGHRLRGRRLATGGAANRSGRVDSRRAHRRRCLVCDGLAGPRACAGAQTGLARPGRPALGAAAEGVAAAPRVHRRPPAGRAAVADAQRRTDVSDLGVRTALAGQQPAGRDAPRTGRGRACRAAAWCA